MTCEQIRLGDWLLEVDIEATRRAYLGARPIDLCGCQGCHNYSALASAFSGDLLAFFQWFGMDPAKEAEVFVYCQDRAGLHFYGGFYHLVARIREQPDPLSFFSVTEQFWVSFTQKTSLVPNDFPQPVLQMEIQAALPWVLKQPSLYETTTTPVRVPMGLVRAENGRITERVEGTLSQDEQDSPNAKTVD